MPFGRRTRSSQNSHVIRIASHAIHFEPSSSQAATGLPATAHLGLIFLIISFMRWNAHYGSCNVYPPVSHRLTISSLPPLYLAVYAAVNLSHRLFASIAKWGKLCAAHMYYALLGFRVHSLLCACIRSCAAAANECDRLLLLCAGEQSLRHIIK